MGRIIPTDQTTQPAGWIGQAQKSPARKWHRHPACDSNSSAPGKHTAATIALALLLSCAGQPPNRAVQPTPNIVLWAWERPTDLRFLKPSDPVGVAFLAASIHLTADQVEVRPRLQPLALPEGISLTAVIRIETDSAHPPSLDDGQVEATVDAILKLADRPGVGSIQIDFDAVRSQRAFYSEVLKRLRPRMSPDKRLSITALASWCLGDVWIEDLPIDEAVPMLFQMGTDGALIADLLKEGRDFGPAVCRHSVGLSLDEPQTWRFPARRVYLFNPDDWSEQMFQKAVQDLESRQR